MSYKYGKSDKFIRIMKEYGVEFNLVKKSTNFNSIGFDICEYNVEFWRTESPENKEIYTFSQHNADIWSILIDFVNEKRYTRDIKSVFSIKDN